MNSGIEFGEKGQKYDHVEFTVANGADKQDIKATVAGSWTKVPFAGVMRLSTTQTIAVRYNTATADPITITSSESPYVEASLVITNLFISNASGSNSNVKLTLIKA